MLKVMLSGGMYKQILMLNYEKMIWGRLGMENEEYYRIIPETELAAARQKREEEHISRRQARHKYEEECAAIMTDEETTAIPMKKIINIQDVEKIELKEIDD